jgi:hypothetical protein
MLIMDTGNTNNEMFCLDDAGKVTGQESLNEFEPVDGKGEGWRYIKQTRFDSAGKRISIQGTFVNDAGESVPQPQLDKDDLKAATRSLSPDLARDVITQVR